MSQVLKCNHRHRGNKHPSDQERSLNTRSFSLSFKPATGQSWTDLYSGYYDRVFFTFTNAMRMDANTYRTVYIPATAYACTTSTLAPLRWDSPLTQAARQLAFTMANCNLLQHDTCKNFCPLYNGSCNW